MLRFTKRADYGLMAIHYIAMHDGLGAISAKRIAEESGIPQELLAKILQRLAKQRLIVSQNGPKGGYVLTRRPAEISVGEVIRALEGPINIVSLVIATLLSLWGTSSSAATWVVNLLMLRALVPTKAMVLSWNPPAWSVSCEFNLQQTFSPLMRHVSASCERGTCRCNT